MALTTKKYVNRKRMYRRRHRRSMRVNKTVSNASLKFKLRVVYKGALEIAFNSGTGQYQADNSFQVFSGVTDCPDWASLSSLYDCFRVYFVKINYYPCSNTNDTAGNVLGYQYYPVHVYYDPDSVTQVETSEEALQYDNCRIFDAFKPFKYTVVPKFITSTTSDNAQPTIFDPLTKVPIMDNASALNYVTGIVGIVSDGWGVTQNNVQLGTIIQTFYVQMYNRR